MSNVYCIRVKGQLDPCWSDWFDGLTVVHEPNDEAVLIGSVADQAALHGLLTKIGELGLPLIAVSRVSSEPESQQ